MRTNRKPQHARRGRLAALALALVAACAVPAVAQSPQAPPGVEITPALVERDLPGREVSLRILVVNHESEPRAITLSVAGLGHDLDGAPEYFEHDPPAAAALGLDAEQFVLDPDTRKHVTVRGAIPPGARSLYAAVVAEFAPLSQIPGQVESRSRVASLLLLRGPKPWEERVQVIDAGIVPGEPGKPVRVTASVKNTGNVHVRPAGTVRIIVDGETLATVALAAQRIIPGYARRLSGTWTPPPGLSGKMILEAETTDPEARSVRTIDLGRGVEATPQGEIVNLRASGENGGAVGLFVHNLGRVPLSAVVVLTAREGSVERARAVLPQPSIAPGATREVGWTPALPDGSYLVTAELRAGETLLDQATTDLLLGAPRSGPSRRHQTGQRAPVILFASLLLFAVLGGIALLVWMRRRDDDERRCGGPGAPDSSREPVGAGAAR